MQSEQPKTISPQRVADRDLNLILLITVVVLALSMWLAPARILVDQTRSLGLRTVIMLAAQFCLMGLAVAVVMVIRRVKPSTYGLRVPGLGASLLYSLAAFLPLFLFYLVRGIQSYTPMINIMTTSEWVAKGFPAMLVGMAPTMFVWGVVQACAFAFLCDLINETDPVENPWLEVGPLYCALFYLVINGFHFSLSRLPEMLCTYATIWALLQARRLSGNTWGMVLVFTFLLNAFRFF